jgi:hypothetical protein
MATFKDKISNLINQQVPEFVLEQHPKFLEFVKSYYSFMESAELVVTSVETTDGILLETETNQNNELILDGSRIDTDRTQLDAGDKILLESTAFGKFTRGETITGQTSNATATVLGEDLDNGRLFISAQDKFVIGETVLGNSSNASAIINNYKPNPVTNIQELLNFRDPDKVISNFLTKFRNEFLNTLPETLDDGIDKRKLIKNVKSLYQAKGTNRGHELFFKLLFGLKSETIYPREQMLRVSDGNWDTKTILRVISTTGNTLNLIGRQITGLTSGATAIVENVFKFRIGANEVSEFILNADTITGTFQTSEEIRGTANDEDDIFIKANITGIPEAVTFTNDGTLYEAEENIAITAGGTGAIVQVDNIGRGGLTDLFISDAGSGYSIGDELVFDNSGTTGSGASGFVSVVNGGITPEDGTDLQIVFEDNSGSVLLETASDGLSTILLETDEPGTVILEDGFKLIQEDSATTERYEPEYLLQDTDYSSTITDHIVLETNTQIGDSYNGDKIVQEEGTGTGDITDVHLRNPGNNYDKLPIISINTESELGDNGKILCYGDEIGRIITSKIVESGAQYELSPSPTLSLRTKVIVAEVSGSFVIGGTVNGETSDGTAITATVIGYDSDRGILTLSDATGTFGSETTITDALSFATGTVKRLDQATATTSVGAVAVTSGAFINQDGHVSENTMKIQDSLYYQDFSYVIKVGQSINLWRDSFKKTIHTGGFYVTGQVNIETTINAGITSPVDGIVSGLSESPIFGILNTLFSTIFGRRLGTEDDGTTLRATPQLGVDPDFDDSTSEHFTPNTRDLTLTKKYKVSFPAIVRQSVRGGEYKFGHAYAGPRMKTLNIYDNPFGSNNMFTGTHTQARTTAFTATGPGSVTMITPLKMVNWADHTIIGLNNSLNGTGVQIQDYATDNLKTYITYPTEIKATLPGFTFDRTITTFDTTGFTFDKTF